MAIESGRGLPQSKTLARDSEGPRYWRSFWNAAVPCRFVDSKPQRKKVHRRKPLRRTRPICDPRGSACMITEKISEIAVKVLDTSGYAGAGFLMALESMIVPVPSEAVMPFVGFQVADGRWNFWLAILVTSIGSIVGSLLSYLMGYYGGKPLVLKVGKYLLLNQRDLERTEKFFHKRQAVLTLFISRFIPVVRHFISI